MAAIAHLAGGGPLIVSRTSMMAWSSVAGRPVVDFKMKATPNTRAGHRANRRGSRRAACKGPSWSPWINLTAIVGMASSHTLAGDQ
jgi:hypothetical protein